MPEYLQGFLTNTLNSLVASGPKIISGLAILFVGWLLAKWTVAGAKRLFKRSSALDEMLERYITKLLSFGVLAMTIIAALSAFGVQTASIIAVLGAMGLAIGLALQGTLSNVAAGLVLLYLRPFRAGEFVDIGGTIGGVNEVGLFSTELKTDEGLYVMIPNSKVWGDKVINFTRNGTRRVDMTFSISYADDMDKALDIIEDIIADDDRVLEEPAPFIKVGELNASSVDIYVRPWATVDDFFAVKLDVTKKVKERFDAEGISIPFPQREIRIVRESQAA
jgi:small conductance mechanosensitive channel